MKIGIISDTHGNMEAVEAVLAQVPDADLWLHAGDFISDARYLEQLADTGVVKVAGNGDWLGADEPNETIVEAAGHRIFLTHGHTYGVNYGTEILAQTAQEENCDIAVYGHTHRAELTMGKIWVINPGSASRPRDDNRPSFMVMELQEGKEPQVKLFRMERE